MTPIRLQHDWYSRSLPTNVTLGERSWLYSSYAFEHYRSEAKIGVRIGDDTGLYHGTFFDLGPSAQLEIGNYCSVVGVIFATNGRITIGDYSLLAHEVVIADYPWSSPMGGRGKELSPSTDAERCVIELGRNVWIGAQTLIIGSVRIGEGAIVGAGTLVTHDILPYTICAGNPMRIIRNLQQDQRRKST